MIWLIFNRLGLIMLAAGVLLFVLLMGMLPFHYRSAALFACGALWALWDGARRARRGLKSLVLPGEGGHLYYVPIWALGLLMLWAGYAVREFDQRRLREEQQVQRRIDDARARRQPTSPETQQAP